MEKQYKIMNHLPYRDIVSQPLFFLSLTALVVGSQLFLAGFLAEMIALNNRGRTDYVIDQRSGC
jgi:hypothetical protein